MSPDAENQSALIADERPMPRLAWQSPAITRVRAGDAEQGPDPITQEGAFGMGDS